MHLKSVSCSGCVPKHMIVLEKKTQLEENPSDTDLKVQDQSN